MITVTYKDGQIEKGFTVEGHANYAPHGTDIVCSAVSTLTTCTIIGVDKYAQCNYEMRSGLVKVDIITQNTATEALLYVFDKSITELAKQYPQHIQVKEYENEKI